MKRFLSYAVLLMSMCMLTACSNDDDGNDSSTNILDYPFLGSWEDGKYLFMNNGKMFVEKGVYEKTGKYSKTYYVLDKEATWKYEKESGILSTTYNGLQWRIGATDSTSWTGLQLGEKTASITFKRSDPINALRLIIQSRKWEDKNGYTLDNTFTGGWLKIGKNGNYKFDMVLCGIVKESLKNKKIFITDGEGWDTITISDPYDYFGTKIDIYAGESKRSYNFYVAE